MSEIQVLNEFKNGIISFFDELIDQFPKEGDLIMFRIFIKDQIPIQDVMNIFTNSINKDNSKIRKLVKDRNEVFFLEHNVFEDSTSVSKNKITHFKKLWRSGSLDDEDKKVVWKWIDSFIYLSDKYAKLKNEK
jgi:hypothetical protein